MTTIERKVPTIETDLDDVFIEEEQETKLKTIEEVIEPLHSSDTVSGLLKVKEKLGNTEVKSSTMILIIKYVMETVEDFPKSGSERKDLALSIIKVLVNELSESGEKTFILETINNGIVSNTIDLIVAATKGELSINTVKEVAVSCIPSCFQYIKSKFVK